MESYANSDRAKIGLIWLEFFWVHDDESNSVQKKILFNIAADENLTEEVRKERERDRERWQQDQKYSKSLEK